MIGKFLTAFGVVALLLNPVVAHAEEFDGKVAGLVEGQKAPFSGVLFDAEAWGKLVIERRVFEKSKQLTIDYEVRNATLLLTKQLELLQNKIDVEKTATNALLDMKTKEINALTTKLLKIEDRTDWTWLYISGGFVAGVGLTVAIVYAAK